MGEILAGYDLQPTTWVYIASLMIVGIFFKFSRVLSVRNLDLLALLAIAPGMLLVAAGRGLLAPLVAPDPTSDREQLGFWWLFLMTGFFSVRLLLDTLMVRRPLLTPNLSTGGLTFTLAALLVFLSANVLTGKVRPGFESGPSAAACTTLTAWLGDGPADQPEDARSQAWRTATTRGAAVAVQLLIVAGLIVLGARHYDNVQTGVAAAAWYVLMPYTAEATACLDHFLPGLLLLWAVVCYRRPVAAGVLLAVAAGLIWYPLLLLPLWCAFYARRGLLRFLGGALATLGAMALILVLAADHPTQWLHHWRQMFGFGVLVPQQCRGFWEQHDLVFRLPVMVALAAVAISMGLWPAQKNLAALLSCTAALAAGAQFVHPYDGGLYLGWYLPLLIAVVLRPNLEDRVAEATVRDVKPPKWLERLTARRSRIPSSAPTEDKATDPGSAEAAGKNAAAQANPIPAQPAPEPPAAANG